MLLTYIPGKGDHLVPIIFPTDTKDALDFLCDKEIRKLAAVKETNPFIFPSTKNSDLHLSGWHAIDRICEKLNLENRSKLNATKNRHRVSTLYSALDLPTEKRDSFYDHMGHTGEMNKKRYIFTLGEKTSFQVMERRIKTWKVLER